VPVEVRAAVSDGDLAEWVGVRNAVLPREPASVDEVRRSRDRGSLVLLASVDGAVAGCGRAARSSMRDAAFALALVLPDFRRRGMGSALYAALSDHARAIGATFLRTRAEEGDAPAIDFLSHRGFVEVARECEVRLDLGAAEPGVAVALPEGVDVVALASRLDLAPQAHALAVEVNGDGPALEGTEVPPFEEWRVENVDEALLDGSFLALAEGRVVGLAGLTGRQADPGLAEHLLTAVSAPWRRRGIARALKLRQVDWARRVGYRELATWNAGTNAPMRRLNQAMGYQPLPVSITFHGPPAPASR
jgi:mycothiol synthase